MNNRWVVLGAGVIIQIIFGGIYAWSTFTPHLIDTYNLTEGECGFIFGLTIGIFTLSMTFAGTLLNQKGPRFTSIVGSTLFFTGYLIASLSEGSFPMLLISLGLISGSGIGFGYVCPLSVGMKWFPENRGLVTGVAVAGFGGGAVLLSSIAEHFLVNGTDVMIFFRSFGFVSGAVLLGASSFMAEPKSTADKIEETEQKKRIFTLPFGITALGMFAGTFGGLLIIGNLTPIALKSGFTQPQGVFMISLFAIGNAIGRITWGQIFDKIDYKSIPISLGSFALFCALFLIPLPNLLLYFTVGLMGFGFGANFVIYASAISRFFGSQAFVKLYPLCFLAYGIAGITGPGAGGYIADQTGSYNVALYISILLLTLAAIITTFGLKEFKKGEV